MTVSLTAFFVAAALSFAPQAPPTAGGGDPTTPGAEEGPGPEIGDSDDLAAKSLGVRYGGVLTLKTPSVGERGPPCDRPSAIDLTPDRPAEIVGTPAFRSKQPLYGAFRLGKGGKTWFALDQSDPKTAVYDELWIDLEQDLDLRSEAGPVRGVATFVAERGLWYCEFTNLDFDLYYGHGPREHFWITLYLWLPQTGLPARALVQPASWREGTIYIDSVLVRIGVADGDADGIFQTRQCMYAVIEDAPGLDLRTAAKWQLGSVPVHIGDRPFKLESVSAEGGRADLSPASEEELKEAVLRADPTLVEPTRARDETPIPWVETYDGALAQAKSSAKTVFVLITAPWSKGSASFAERTLKDAEVRHSLDGFVCVRLDPDRDRELAERFEVDALPLVLLVDGDGRVLERVAGYRAARSLADTLAHYRKN